LISKRVYKEAFSHETAVDIISRGKGVHFDPDITDAFLEIHETFRKIATQFTDQEA
jgi:putative two-component system response regulator